MSTRTRTVLPSTLMLSKVRTFAIVCSSGWEFLIALVVTRFATREYVIDFAPNSTQGSENARLLLNKSAKGDKATNVVAVYGKAFRG